LSPNTFRTPFGLSISTTRASICGTWRVNCTPTMRCSRKRG
jgi:hypothetical protein